MFKAAPDLIISDKNAHISDSLGLVLTNSFVLCYINSPCLNNSLTQTKFPDYMQILIGWQAYRGDQIHRKTCST